MSKLLKNLIVVLAIIVVGAIAYSMISSEDDVTDATLESGQTNSEVGLEIEKILANTKKLDAYILDVSIFTNPKFTSLKDFSVEIVDVGTGRPNPFEPVR